MAGNKKNSNYISAKESRRISKNNRKITKEMEKKRNRKNIPEAEYVTKMHNAENCVEFDNVHTYFFTDIGTVKSVNGVTFDVPQGKTVGIVGESGCGKSVTSLSLMQLVQRPSGQTVEGEIRFNAGDKVYNVVNAPTDVMQKLRGNYMSMIFQEPMTSLNPVFTIEKQIGEVFRVHQGMDKKQAAAEAVRMLGEVKIPNPERVAKQYPFQLSGGMRQRVMIAMALACKPKLLIADEPTTALDVTIQAQILKLMNDMKEKLGTSILFITHDLGVINEMADKVAVMYCGQVVEMADAKTIFTNGAYSHPYTEGLMISIPRLDTPKGEKLDPIPGAVPNPLYLPKGCKFAPRCKYCKERCMEEEPGLVEVEPKHQVRCHYAEKAVRNSNAD